MTTSTFSPSGTAPAGARERLLAAAEALIYAGGIHATGVDAIVKLSGTARKSFYTHFESKEALVAAALERRDERWMNWFIEGTQRHGGSQAPRERLLGMFEVLREWFSTRDFHGCAFLNAAGEIGSPDDPIRVVAREHKLRLLAFVRGECEALAAAAGRPENWAASLARQWLILIDGAIGVALVGGDPDTARDAREAAALVLDAQLAAGGTTPAAAPASASSSARSSSPPSRRSSTRHKESP